MKRLVETIVGIGKHQSANLWHACRGEPVVVPSLASMTLEPDDVALAQSLLDARACWARPEPVAAFESRFADWLGVPVATAWSSGREALSACLEALALAPGDEVVVPGYTCIVVPNAVRFAAAEPVFADIELETFGPDARAAEGALTARTRAIVIHHLYGLVGRDTDAILALARRRGIAVIEDCTHAAGARLRGAHVGTLGDLAFFSSEQSKCFNTIRGGVAVARDPELGARLRAAAVRAAPADEATVEILLRTVVSSYAQRKDPRRWWRGDLVQLTSPHRELPSLTEAELRYARPPGYGRTMAAPIAALASLQLAKLDRFNSIRRASAARWDAWCAASGRPRPGVVEDSEPTFLRYPVLVRPEEKADTGWVRRELGVAAGKWFTGKLHPIDVPIPGCPRADEAVARCINLPTILS